MGKACIIIKFKMMSMNYPKGIYVLLDHNGGRVFLAFLSDCRTSSLHIARTLWITCHESVWQMMCAHAKQIFSNFPGNYISHVSVYSSIIQTKCWPEPYLIKQKQTCYYCWLNMNTCGMLMQGLDSCFVFNWDWLFTFCYTFWQKLPYLFKVSSQALSGQRWGFLKLKCKNQKWKPRL